MPPRGKKQKVDGGDLRSCFQAGAAVGATSEATRPEKEIPEMDLATWQLEVVRQSRSYYGKRKDRWWQELSESVLRCKKHPRVEDFERQEEVDSSSFYWVANPKELVQKFDAFVAQLEGQEANPTTGECAPEAGGSEPVGPEAVSSGDDNDAGGEEKRVIVPDAEMPEPETLVDAETLPAAIPVVQQDDKVEIEIVKEKGDQITVEQNASEQNASDDRGKAEQEEDAKGDDPVGCPVEQDVFDDKGTAQQNEDAKVNDESIGGCLGEKGKAEQKDDPIGGPLEQDVFDDKGTAQQNEDDRVSSDAAMKLAACASSTPCPVVEACLFAERRVAANIENTIAIKHGHIPILHPEWPDTSATDDDYDPLWIRGGNIPDTFVMIPPKINHARKAEKKQTVFFQDAQKEPGSSSKKLSQFEPDDSGRESFLGSLVVSPLSPSVFLCDYIGLNRNIAKKPVN